MQVFSKINLDLLRPSVQVIVNAKQNDKASRFIQANLWEGGQPFAPGSVLATFRVLKPDGTAAFYDTNENGDPAITLSGNIATIELVEQVLTVPGDVAAELNLYTADGEKLTSFTFTIRVQASVLNDAEISSSDYFNVLTNTLAQAQAAADRAEAAADRAEDLSGELVKSVNGQAPDSSGAVSIDVGVLEVNNQTPDAEGAVTIDVGVMTVNNQTPDENGNVNVQAGVTSVFGREGAVTAEPGDYDITQITGAKRENLLINAWFLNPVNQRGETSYLRNGYTIDMWKTANASTEVSLTANGIKVVQTYTSQPRIIQLTETVFPAGTTMTVSAIMKGDGINAPKIQVSKVFSSDTIFIGEANNDEWQMVTGTFVTELEGAPSVALYCSTNNENHPVLEVASAKLELGEGQTLAHQDADGNWVFNGIPNYAEELAKCQRYFYAVRTTGNNMLATAIANTTTNLLFAMPLPVPMRANPAASYSNLSYSKSGGSAGSAPSSVSPISTINNETAIRTLMLGGSFTTGTPYALILTDGGYLYLDANL